MRAIHNHKTKSAVALLSLLAAFGLQGCQDEEQSKWVDLRYRVDDAYIVPHHATETEDLSVSFLVKSTDPWEVYGKNNESWYTISPATGDDPEQTYTVTITCQPNESLDARLDTFYIKSDYWTGKEFTLTQEGTAFLTQDYNPVEGEGMIPMEGTPITFTVTSNQNWTAEVTEGDWLHITSGASGSGDGSATVETTVTLEADPNTGARRYGTLVIYDRNGDAVQTVSVTQDGVQIEPVQPENGNWWPMYDEAQQLVIHVESNSCWQVSKENELNDAWFDFEQTEFEGSVDLVINVQQHDAGSNVRSANIILSSVSDDPDIEPVSTTIRIKQASSEASRTTTHDENTTVTGDYYFSSGMQPGRYNFYVGPFGDSYLELFFMWSGVVTSNGEYCQFNYKVQNSETHLSTTPWSSAIFNENSIHPVDTSVDNVLSIDYTLVTDANGTWLRPEFLLNGTSFGATVSDGSHEWRVAYSAIQNVNGQLLMRCTSGSIPFIKWEYISPIDWGE